MTYAGSGNGLVHDYSSLYSEPGNVSRPQNGESGYKRHKIAGFLKAANEVRQSYFSGSDPGTAVRESGDEGGAFPDATVARSGNEEMMLFPSYARRHATSKPMEPPPGIPQSEQDYWAREWDKHQHHNAVVDADVRGWIYTPHRGPHTRKQRIFLGVARQIAGVPAPPAGRPGDTLQSSQAPSRAASPSRLSHQEEDLITLEADKIARRGEAEERIARRGDYSEDPRKGVDSDSLYSADSRAASPDRGRDQRLSIASTLSSGPPSPALSPTLRPLRKRASWTQPSKMSPAELAIANKHLMSRLKPFMYGDLANSAVTAFFYNDRVSRQHTVLTNANGHFHFRVSLDFMPTHVRVLAGEKLSITEEIHITPPRGVSLISDIDDTVKHSGISKGMSEVVRNAFIREFGDLTIEGVREWYTTLHDMGVKLHYVSNSPWQMYPALTGYFKLANLPRGSFHLKLYDSWMSGLFEPVAERKKSSIEKLLRDFPERKFILVGDSGEADLEVYTDTAMEHPNRILGIFIRDVTTPIKTGYFDSAMGPAASGGRHSRSHSRHRSGDTLAMSKRLSRPDDIRDDDAELKAAIAASLKDMERETHRAKSAINPDLPSPEVTVDHYDGVRDRRAKPELPRRPVPSRVVPEARMATSPEEEDLIDFGESESAPSKPRVEAPPQRTSSKAGQPNGLRPTPSPPPKPQALRSPSPGSQATPTQDSPFKAPPPRPRKPSSTVKPPSPHQAQPDVTETSQPPPAAQPQLQTQYQQSPLSQVSGINSPTATRDGRPPLPTRPRTFQKLANAAGSYWHGQAANGHSRPQAPTTSQSYAPETPRSFSASSAKSLDDLRGESTPRPIPSAVPPPPPPRRNGTSYPFSTSRKSSNRLSGTGFDGEMSMPGSPGDGMDKKEMMWRQRWARAQQALEPRGIILRTWRVGSDVADVCVRLVERELRRIEKESPDDSGKE